MRKPTFHSGMENLVTSQIFFADERFAALLAVEWFGPFVHVFHVQFQASPPIERFPTKLAGETIFSWSEQDENINKCTITLFLIILYSPRDCRNRLRVWWSEGRET